MDEAVIKKKQPNSMEAEQSVIGSMLMDRDAIVEVADILTKDDFYYSQFGLLFEAMLSLYNEGKPVDLLTVSEKLKEMGAPDSVSSMEYVGDIINMVPTSSHAKQYAQIVQDKAVLRKMIRFTEKTTEACYLGQNDVADLLEDSEKELFDIVQKRNGGVNSFRCRTSY